MLDVYWKECMVGHEEGKKEVKEPMQFVVPVKF